MTDLLAHPEGRQSPLLLRRYLAQRLVELRDAAGMSQVEVAGSVQGISKPKLQYLELAKRPLQDNDLLTLLRLFEVPRREHDKWLELAQAARAKGRYDHYDEADLPDEAKLAADYEWGARRIRLFTGQIVPALLQTPEYASTLVAVHRVGRSREEVAKAVEVRLMRQQILNHPDDPVEYHAIVDQAALERTAFGIQGAAEQLQHLIDVVQSQDNVTFQVVPWEAGHYKAQVGGFTLMDFGLPRHPGLLQLEPGLLDPVHVDNRHEIYQHSQAFDEAAEVALSAKETLGLLHTVAEKAKRSRL